jgi:peptide/nickel transport system permease protein
VILRLVGRRLLQAIPVIFGASLITFALLNLLPGNTAIAILGDGATPSAVKNLDRELGLNETFFVRYGHWLWSALQGHLGQSLVSPQSVIHIISQRLPVTLELVVVSTLIALVATIPVSLVAARRPGGVADRVSVGVSMVGLSIPGFVVALVLILVFAVHLKILPATGFIPISSSIGENLKSIVLPSITLAYGIFCGYTRVLRADLVDQMASEDYVVLARAKGLSRWKVLVHHAFRNAMFPFITLIGLHFGTLIGGTVIVESIFALPGIGQLLITSIQTKDAPVVQAIVVLVAVSVVLANMVTDLLYAAFDPRVNYDRRAS